MARPDFRSQAAERLATERTEHTPVLIDLLSPDEPSTVTEVHHLDIERITSNPNQPRQSFDVDALQDLAASIREHGILQPVLVRPRADGHFELVAGERRWRAARIAGLRQVPAIIEQIDDEAALEIAIIENLQREDISPLEEAEMFERMTSQHGYSLRKLAQKLGKDKGYIENRLRLADAPPEIRELVSVRSDTLSAAYELMKVSDPRRRRRLAAQVATGELSLARLRLRIEGRPEVAAASSAALAGGSVEEAAMGAVMEADADQSTAVTGSLASVGAPGSGAPAGAAPEAGSVGFVAVGPEAAPGGVGPEPVGASARPEPVGGSSGPEPVAIAVEPEGPAVDAPQHVTALVDIDQAARQLSHAVDELVAALLGDASLAEASSADRQLFAKYLTINKVKLENAIAVVRVAGTRTTVPVHEPRD